MTNIYSTRYVIRGPKESLYEIHHTFNGLKCDDLIPNASGDKFVSMDFNPKKGLIIRTSGKNASHECNVVAYILSINSTAEVSFMTNDQYLKDWYKYDPDGVFDDEHDVIITIEANRMYLDTVPSILKTELMVDAGCDFFFSKDIEGITIPQQMHLLRCKKWSSIYG